MNEQPLHPPTGDVRDATVSSIPAQSSASNFASFDAAPETAVGVETVECLRCRKGKSYKKGHHISCPRSAYYKATPPTCVSRLEVVEPVVLKATEVPESETPSSSMSAGGGAVDGAMNKEVLTVETDSGSDDVERGFYANHAATSIVDLTVMTESEDGIEEEPSAAMVKVAPSPSVTSPADDVGMTSPAEAPSDPNKKEKFREGEDEERQMRRELRRKRRRTFERKWDRLSKLSSNPDKVPSFVAMITPDPIDNDDLFESTSSDDEKEAERLQRKRDEDRRRGIICIDVDEALGLKKVRKGRSTSASVLLAAREALGLPKIKTEIFSHVIPPVISASKVPAHRTDVQTSLDSTPADEGYYEGAMPLSLPDDPLHLSELHCLIRSNMELFSATEKDIAMGGSGRRAPVVRGKVGLRCIHCARALEKATDGASFASVATPPPSSSVSAPDKYAGLSSVPLPDGHISLSSLPLSPPKNQQASPRIIDGRKRSATSTAGSTSYPANISGIYQAAANKPTLHFLKCPHTPSTTKAKFYALTHDANGNPIRQTHSVGTASGGVITNRNSAVKYYAMAARRIGLVDVKDGIRFGRGLKLDPLPIGEVKVEAAARPGMTVNLVPSAAVVPPPPEPLPRITADDESEKVLACAVAEIKSNPNQSIIRPEDRPLVTDFVYLVASQMRICHAIESDFKTPGKKTKSMRLGWAGLCCRCCSPSDSSDVTVIDPMFGRVMDYSCRSFASAPDNLASVVSGSFHGHLTKCPQCPPEFIKALIAYGKIHKRQMARLPHGSQRRFFGEVWRRLRESDWTEEQVLEHNSKVKKHNAKIAEHNAKVTEVERGTDAGSNSKSSIARVQRHPSFPKSTNEDTLRTLATAAQEDTALCDNLVLPEDQLLATDHIFLTMKQMKVAYPNAADFARCRRGSVVKFGFAGLCCRHCADENLTSFPHGVIVGGGRSFPSQADNLSTCLTVSFHQHMQRCPAVPAYIRNALNHLKTIHSAQVAALRFGSQRRFFQLVFGRLRALDKDSAELEHAGAQQQKNRGEVPDSGANRISSALPLSDSAKVADDDTIAEHGFRQSSVGWYVCQKCRMVPHELRAAQSMCTNRPTKDYLQSHRENCKGDQFDLSNVTELAREFVKSVPGMTIDKLVSAPFKDVVRALVGGNEELVMAFTHGVVVHDQNRQCPDNVSVKTEGLWSQFPSKIDKEKVRSALKAFVDATEGVSLSTLGNKAFVNYMQLVSPCCIDFPTV